MKEYVQLKTKFETN